MSRIGDYLARKTSGDDTAPSPIASNQEDGVAAAEDSALPAHGGLQLGAENEALRGLVVDAARKIEELDTLKLAFGRIIDPLQRTLQTLEQEKARNASLTSSLGESRTAVETLRAEVAQREKTAAALNAANEKLQLELEQSQQTAAGLETLRIDLLNQTALKNSEIADLENRLSTESIARQALVDEHRIVNDQAQISGKRLAALDTEIVAARQKITLAEDERQSLQSALEQALADMSRVSRQLTESNNSLTAAQTRVTQLEANFAEADSERLRLLSSLDEVNERHRSENGAQTMRLDALQSRTTTAEKLLIEARTNLAARADEIRSFERKITEATIARNAAEKKLAQIEGAQLTQERMIKDLEQARTALLERNTALGKTVRTRENELVRAEEKIQASNELIARLETDIQNSRTRAEKRIEELNALLEHERMDRAVAEGALEATRKDNARLQRENSRLEALQRANSAPAFKN